MPSTIRYCAMALAAAGLLFAPVVAAQTQTPSAPSAKPGSPATSEAISDTKLDQAATAAKKVAALQNTYEQKLARAPVTEKKQIADEADNEMAKAVTDQGLSVDEFTTIMRLAQDDPVVRNKLLDRLK